MAKKPRKPPAATQDDLEFQARIHRQTLVASAYGITVRWGSLVAVAYIGYLSISALAGETTAAQIGITVLGDIRVSEAFAWLFGVGGVGYGVSQRRFRLRANETLGKRVSELEQEVDPGRTSSKLTTRGETDPKDKI